MTFEQERLQDGGVTLTLDAGERAVVTLLLLRGPQTPGELRTRSERLHEFDFEVDGLVIKVNDYEQRRRLGAAAAGGSAARRGGRADCRRSRCGGGVD